MNLSLLKSYSIWNTRPLCQFHLHSDQKCSDSFYSLTCRIIIYDSLLINSGMEDRLTWLSPPNINLETSLLLLVFMLLIFSNLSLILLLKMAQIVPIQILVLSLLSLLIASHSLCLCALSLVMLLILFPLAWTLLVILLAIPFLQALNAPLSC